MPLTCKSCRTYLTAYVHGELTPRARRRVDAHLNGCRACAAEYTRHSRAARDLRSTIVHMGQPSRTQLSSIWMAVQSDLEIPSKGQERRYSPLRVGAFAFALILALMLPPLLNGERVYAQIPDPPTPLLMRVTYSVSPEAFLIRTTETREPRNRANREPHLMVLIQNIAPTPGATEQP